MKIKTNLMGSSMQGCKIVLVKMQGCKIVLVKMQLNHVHSIVMVSFPSL